MRVPVSDHGFTLVELLIVMVLIAVLSAIALPQMSTTRDRSVVAAIQNDLRNLMVAQEAHFSENFIYAGDLSVVEHMIKRSKKVELEMDSATATGWGATGTHPAVNVVCRVAVSSSHTTNPDCEVE